MAWEVIWCRLVSSSFLFCHIFSFTAQDVRKKEHEKQEEAFSKVAEPVIRYMSDDQRKDLLEQMTEEMLASAKDLEFERAAMLRDEIDKLKKMIK
ncbi:MAG: excinuclease ABC B subunit [Stygiobacter sp.]|nr:MAG: excinuclease ABC B subunit [Stygiobacter sp.]KAF0217613.1 MAG: excinuclease ABC B [Ignavibacteria bacterium]